MVRTTRKVFDYSDVRPEVRDKLRELAGIFEAPPRTAVAAVMVGKSLQEAQRLIGWGAFRAWAETESDWSRDFVTRCLAAASFFGSLRNAQIAHFGLSAVYKLSKRRVPEAARTLAIQEASRGEKITHARALEIVKRYLGATETEEQAVERAKSPSFAMKIYERGFHMISQDIHPDDNGNDVYSAAAFHRETGKRIYAVRSSPELALLVLAGEEPVKTCRGKCKESKGVGLFGICRSNPDGREDVCKACKRG